jgi:diguanylate cyclase (GGDEF)-like protein/PAS domain S-box-containing protein
MGDADLYKDRLALALEAAGLDLWENNLLTGEVTRKASQTFLSLGYSDEETAAYIEQAFQLVHPDDVEGVKASVNVHLAGQTPQYHCEFRLKAKDGRWVWFANYGKVMDAHANTPGQRFIGVTFNIDDRKRREQEIDDINRQLADKNTLLERYNHQLELLATTDSLTGLVNRRRLMELGISECKRAERFQHTLSLLMIDIDFFKAINDSWGHQVGDHVICTVGSTCSHRVRQGVDIVARVGGEEFVVLLPETDHAQACALAETLRLAIATQPVSVNERGDLAQFTVSIGVATYSDGSVESFEELLNQADKALYKAKQAGRNQVAQGLRR